MERMQGVGTSSEASLRKDYLQKQWLLLVNFSILAFSFLDKYYPRQKCSFKHMNYCVDQSIE